MSGFQLRCFDALADKVSIQSSEGATRYGERHRMFRPRPIEVTVPENGLIVLKNQDPSDYNHVSICPDVDGLVITSSRRGAIYAKKGKVADVNLQPGEAVTVRRYDAREPTRPHRPAMNDRELA